MLPSTVTLEDVLIEEDADGLTVAPVWSGVDRPRTGGVGLPATKSGRALADRLVRAIKAGAAYPAEGVRTDVNGKTYVATRMNVLGRRLNADLRGLGF